MSRLVKAALIPLLAGLVLASTALPAGAHTRSETQSVWRIIGPIVHLTFTVPNIEAKRLTPNGAQPTDAQLSAYLAQHVGVLHNGKACPRDGNIQTIQGAPGFRRYEFTFKCPDANGIALHSSAFFKMVPTHTTYAQIVEDNGNFISQIFTADRQTLDLSTASGASELQNASFFEYIYLGIMHIFTGPDHQAFILGLVLLSRKVRDLLFVVTGFTIGHSITLALAVTGIIRPHPEFIDALVGLTIALVAAENLGESGHRMRTVAGTVAALLLGMAALRFAGVGSMPALILIGAAIFAANYLMISNHLKDAARLRLVVTLIFGTIHGFSFAANLLSMRLPTGRLAELLVGFNSGVEIGQLCVVGVILGFVAILRKVHLTLPRPIVVDVVSAALIGVGFYWLASRGFAPVA